MRTVQSGPVVGPIFLLSLLAALAGTVGLSGFGWMVGITCGVVTNVALARGLARSHAVALGPADRVTLTRATLVGGVAALVADSIIGPGPVTTLVALAVVALVLDAVDGWVARRTQTTSMLGARFDMEVDAFLIFVLSVYVASSTGGWVLAIGAARYVFVAAGWLLPWMRGSSPPRYWGKVVAATQGIVLTVVAAGVLPSLLADAVLLGAIALLGESFGREVWWLWRHRCIEPVRFEVPGDTTAHGPADNRRRVRAAAGAVTTVLACLLVWFALLAPNEISRFTLSAFVRIPVEGLIVIALVLATPFRARRIVAALAGVVLGLLIIVKIIDMGFFAALDRSFNSVTDWGYFGPAVGVLSDSIGRVGAIASVVAAAVLVVAVIIFMTLSSLRLTRLMDHHRTGSIRAVTAFGVVWILGAAFGVQIVPGAPIASTSAAGLAFDQVREVRAGAHDLQSFDKAAALDPFRDTPGNDLLTGLRGKDVIVAFVESYGRVAVQGSAFSKQVDAVLDAGTSRLHAAGFSSRSAFLTSPTFAGISWLAHSTFQSGVWVNNQQRYDKLVAGDRLTLSGAFKRAGWRTVGDVPSNHRDWPEGKSFYHYDKIYDARNVGYLGPKFSYASMPDQYILSAFRRLELAKTAHAPVMAEIDLVSSHTPWTPLPHMIDWSKVGDGSVFDDMPAQGESPASMWRHDNQVRTGYGRSVEYSLNTLISFVQTYPDDNLVLIVLGDHQPAAIVSGHGASHDVPITIIAHDPAVMDRISEWGWQDGMRPDPQAPVWPMDAFRNRFLTAYGPQASRTSP